MHLNDKVDKWCAKRGCFALCTHRSLHLTPPVRKSTAGWFWCWGISDVNDLGNVGCPCVWGADLTLFEDAPVETVKNFMTPKK